MNLLRGKFISLRIVRKLDIQVLSQWRNSDHFINSCSTRRNKISIDEFTKELVADLSRDRYRQFMILKGSKPVGTIYAYGLNRTDGYIFITTYICKEWERQGYGAEAFVIFVNYLFKELNLYKIYCDVYSYNKHSCKCLTDAGFFREGLFKGHRLMGNVRYDMIRFAFFSDQVKDLERFMARLTK